MTEQEDLQAKGQRLNQELTDILQQVFQYNRDELAPENMRVAIASTQVLLTALTNLLVGKGLIDQEEYLAEICTVIQAEIDSYRTLLNEPTDSGF